MYYPNIKLEKTATPNKENSQTLPDVEFTPILRKPYLERIEANSKPGKERSAKLWRFNTFAPLIHLFDTIEGKPEDFSYWLSASLAVDGYENTLLASRELVHYLTNGFGYKEGSRFRSGQMLLKLSELGIVDIFCNHDYEKGEAREAIINPLPEDEILKRLETIGYTLAKKAFSELKDYLESQLVRLGVNPWNWRHKLVKQFKETLKIAKELERYRDPKTGKATLTFLEKLVERLLPIRRDLKNALAKRLKKKKKLVVKKDYDPSTQGNGTSTKTSLHHNHSNPSSLLVTLPSSSFSPPPSSSFSFSTSRSLASLLFSSPSLSLSLSSLSPLDPIDSRQISVMSATSPLPSSYSLLSPASPRFYSSEKENLFYCRKSLRLQAMSGLGLKDVDLQSAHANIAIALWGENLPILKEELSKGTLWDYYRRVFESAGIPFYKDIVKGFHYSTFLCGGKKALYDTCHKYNNKVSKKHRLSKEDQDKIVKCFRNSPICKELKALHRKLCKEWNGTRKVTLTGESFIVKETNWAKLKKTGINDGNFPTVLSAILQAYEVSLMSYVVLRTQNLFKPVLWQHDGVTIYPIQDDTVEKMQEAVNEFCDANLNGHRLTLTVDDL